MITTSEMETVIRDAINVPHPRRIRFGLQHFSFDSVHPHSIYAAFVYSSLAKAMLDLGWQLRPRLHAKNFVFSMGRANITSTNKRFSFIKFRKGKRIYELHCGLNVQSVVQGVVIEIDILIIPRKHGTACRDYESHVDYKEIKCLLEVKHYLRRFDVSKAKEFVGTCHLVRHGDCYAALVAKDKFTKDALTLFKNIQPPLGAFPNADLAGATSMARDVIATLDNIIQ